MSTRSIVTDIRCSRRFSFPMDATFAKRNAHKRHRRWESQACRVALTADVDFHRGPFLTPRALDAS